ncbi:hypothetical protein HY031_02175 [Candidatus Gottesmanbacteria bacterium]|nr:hypothetical protein [Candidatus Gottesmanbacteria bacterium]
MKKIPSRFVPLLVTVILFAIAIGLRFYRFGDFVNFQSDGASDLFIAREIVRDNFRPRVGPWLTLSWVHTPPV